MKNVLAQLGRYTVLELDGYKYKFIDSKEEDAINKLYKSKVGMDDWYECNDDLSKLFENSLKVKTHKPCKIYESENHKFKVFIRDNTYFLRVLKLDFRIQNHFNKTLNGIKITTDTKPRYYKFGKTLYLPKIKNYDKGMTIPKRHINLDFFDKLSVEFDSFIDFQDAKYRKSGRPTNQIEKVRIATYIDHRLNKELRVYAAKNGLGLNDVLEAALSEYLELFEYNKIG